MDFVEFLTLIGDLQGLKKGGLNKEKLKKSSQLSALMNLAVQRADEVRTRKLFQIEQAQKEKEIIVQQNLKERQLKSQKAVLVKENEKKLIAARNEKARKASIIRLQQNESSIDEAIAAKDEIIRQKALEGQQRAEQEKKKVFLLAQQKADVTTQKNVESQRRKKQLELQDEQVSIAAEKLRQEQRMINARRADIERMFTRVQLEALREQFDEADADNSDSIDANELMAVCRSLGENLSMKQVKALIAEVDDDGSGEIEWEEYLIIMGKKRKDAMKKGSGLFQKMSMRSDAASIKKDEQIRKRLKENEEKSKLAAIDREKKKNKADKRKAKEKKMILKKNQMKQAKGLEGAEQVEIAKKIAEAEKKKRVQEKELKARQVEKDIVKQKKMAVVQKKKEKEERARLAEIRRQDKEKYEESLRVIKEKIVTAKTAGKKQVVRLLTDKLKQMQDNNKTKNKKKLGGSIVPKRPATNNKKIGKGKGAKSNGRKVFNPAESSYA